MEKLFVERILPVSLLLEINKQSRTYKGKYNNMFMIVESIEEAFDSPENVDLERNIILCSPSDVDIISFNNDGTLSLNLERDENLSTKKVARDGRIGIFDYSPRIKLSIPQGIKLNIDSPSFQLCFFDKIYPNCKMFYQGAIDEDSVNDSTINLPPYIMMTDFDITFHIDLMRLRSTKGSFLLKKGYGVANLYFVKLIHFVEQPGNQVDNIIYIRNTEIFNTFIDVF